MDELFGEVLVMDPRTGLAMMAWRYEEDETFPEGALLITDTDTVRVWRGRPALLAHVRKGLLPGRIVENIGHDDEDGAS
jgi:hypothetical protein